MKTTALVPCFNEEKRIGRVLEVMTKSPSFDQVVVVDDGSQDGSRKVVRKYPEAKLVSLPKNIGKGGAVRKGLDFVETPIVFLCAADLHGLEEKHIRQVLEPVKKSQVELCVGVRYKGGAVFQWLRRHVLPLIAGERAIKTSLLEKILSSPLSDGFGLEPYMNFYCNSHGVKIEKVDLRGVNDISKIKKRGAGCFFKELINFVRIYSILLLLRIKKTTDNLT